MLKRFIFSGAEGEYKACLGRVGKVLDKHKRIVKRARTRGLWVVVSMQEQREYIIQSYITCEANTIYRSYDPKTYNNPKTYSIKAG